MKTMRSAALVCLLAGLACLGGCEKKVNLQFVNMTGQAHEVELMAPGAGTFHVGPVSAGGRTHYTLKFDEEDLPSTCSWKADDQSGQFVVDKKTSKELRIVIGPVSTIGPIKKDDEVHQKKEVEIKDIPIKQHEVVE